MLHHVPMPKLGETTDVVVIDEWLVAVGDTVHSGQAIVNAETDKVTAEVVSPVTGVVGELLVEVGDEVSTGHHICVIEIA
ncbi:biotin/lipoyl-containing protein [Pseudonocardia sp. GCM10023141]|uniref:biotin/lipoyl-containing protein n=1 Tax=Pseudonocardia sp. GCM10023141 TaxID=3252653 RepID=UPI00360B2F32